MEITLYNPYDKQLEVHNACNDKETFFITVNASRQTGKSTLAQNQIIKWALENTNVVCLWISPTASQTLKAYKNILTALDGAPFIKSHKQSQGDIEILFTNGSVIKFKSGAAEDGLRGETVAYVVVDEAAFLKETTFYEIILPMTSVAGKKCLVISTPKGKNWFYKLYNSGITNTEGYKSFKFNCYQNPYANKLIIEIAKNSMPDIMFRQEYLAEFVDGGSIIENIEELCILPLIKGPMPRINYYAGIDVALQSDFTVISIVDSTGNLVAYDRFSNVTGPQLKKRIIDYLSKWNPRHTLLEVNNMGQVIYDDLVYVHKIKNISPFSTTIKSKPEIINKLIDAFASKTIKCVNDEIVKSELETFEMKITSGGNVRYAAAEGYHDDIVMSLAIAREAIDTANNNSLRVRFIN